MNLEDARKLFSSLMDEHGLLENGWTFGFDSAERRFGQCQYGAKHLTLSRVLTELNERPAVEDVIRHEIAHALAGRGAGHGPFWVQTAQSIGCAATRCYGDEVVQTPPRWIGTCPNCGKQSRRQTLFKKARTMACGDCCRKYNGGKHSKEFVMTWKENR